MYKYFPVYSTYRGNNVYASSPVSAAKRPPTRASTLGNLQVREKPICVGEMGYVPSRDC